jgi:hypothetical protein
MRVVIVLAVQPVPRRGRRHWEMAGMVAFAGVVLLISALVARGVFGESALTVLSAFAATSLAVAVVRVEVPEEDPAPASQEPKTVMRIIPRDRKDTS